MSNINSVIPPGHPINLVMSYDPVGKENWIVSERNPETNQDKQRWLEISLFDFAQRSIPS